MSLAQVGFGLSVWWVQGCLCLQAASAQTADPIEDATKAARPGVLLVRASVFGSADGGLCLLVQDEPLQKTALENEAPAKTANRCVRQMRWQKHGKAPLHPAGSGCGKTTARCGPERAGGQKT